MAQLAQCGINSSNTDLFPVGDLAGAPADDSPFDEYACVRDSAEYQIEPNFGQEALPAPRTIEFTFNIADQRSVERYMRYHHDVTRICSASVPGVYSGTTRISANRETTFTFTLNIESGVSGSVLLPPVHIENILNRDFGPHMRPTLTVNGTVHALPQVTMIASPTSDYRIRLSRTSANVGERPNPMVLLVDGVPGMVMMADTMGSMVQFDPTEWAPFKGISFPEGARLDYTIGAYRV